ncbi:MAG: type ISP restriction/modification enzyme [bacterium]
MPKHPVETYLSELHEIRATGGGSAEISYYGALEALLNEVGRKLKPKVRCVHNLVNTGAGFPDFGLYTANQFQKAKNAEPLPGQLPERGVIEVKPTDDDSWLTAKGTQVTKYWGRYGQVLVTNYRDFVFIGRDERDKPVKLETFRLADTENAFWAATTHPRKTAQDKGDRLIEFLCRIMQHAAAITDPEDLAWFLASYAREAKARIEAVSDLPGLAALRGGLEESLGLRFEGEEGEHFFRATLIQTLFYGVFSSWVLWARDNGTKETDRFNWHEAAWNLHVPMIAGLFQQIATPNKLKPLGLDEILDWTGMALNRIVRDKFFEKFEEEQAVQYFYEPFLKAYDPDLRKKLGVWYTPQEIVKYQVARVDTVLREELDIEDGLADPSVYVLDPCCGTGAYLVEVLRSIHRTLKEKGADALTAQQLKKAAMERVFGFEILPAPFVVSHLQLGLMLRTLGAPLSENGKERVGVYLTNALTGWEPPKSPKDQLAFPELQEELEESGKVKREVPILVVLGNPPYNAFAGTSPAEERGLVESFKDGLTKPVKDGGWGIKKFNLDDLYVRFFRIAERRIVKSGMGVVSYISNFSYLGDPSFVVMRQRFLDEFDKLWFDSMNGDSRETGKKTPDGKPDPSVFSTEQSRVGIRVGTAICTMVRRRKRSRMPTVRFRHFWGATKRADVLNSLKVKKFNKDYDISGPNTGNRFSFRPQVVDAHYLSWPKLTALCGEAPSNGLMEKRGGSLIDVERQALERRVTAYFDANLDWEGYRSLGYGLEKPKAGIDDPEKLRKKAIAAEPYKPQHLVRYSVRPFEIQWAYYCAVPGVWNRARPNYKEQCWEGNTFIITRPAGVASVEGTPLFFTSTIGDNDSLRGHAYYFPVQFRPATRKRRADSASGSLALEIKPQRAVAANLSNNARAYLKSFGISNPDMNAETASLIWMHALAIGYSPAYLSENADGIRQDWPRIPLPDSKKALLASAKLGNRVAALLDTERGLSGVTSGRLRAELKTMGIVSRVGGGSLTAEEGGFGLTAGWGHAGKAGVTMPGRGKIEERAYTGEELEAFNAGAKGLGLTLKQVLEHLGKNTLDVYLNDMAYWKNIPVNVWDYHIGGYQVIKKWLSYREKSLLGRSLKMEEVEYVTDTTRRIAAIILLQPTLDTNYEAVKSDTYVWSD